MTNGVLHLTMGGKRRRLILDFNALCALEDQLARPAVEVLAAFQTGQLTRAQDLRAIAWAALMRHHPQASLEDAGDVLDAHPDCIARLLDVALPEPEASAPGKKPAAAPSRWRRCWISISGWACRSRNSGA